MFRNIGGSVAASQERSTQQRGPRWDWQAYLLASLGASACYIYAIAFLGRLLVPMVY